MSFFPLQKKKRENTCYAPLSISEHIFPCLPFKDELMKVCTPCLVPVLLVASLPAYSLSYLVCF